MLLSDDSEGPRIGQSFIILAFPIIEKKNAGQMDGPTNGLCNRPTEGPMDRQTLL